MARKQMRHERKPRRVARHTIPCSSHPAVVGNGALDKAVQRLLIADVISTDAKDLSDDAPKGSGGKVLRGARAIPQEHI